jgi:4-diphosphocytidyl-2-C-methyl-D-erythritol kinase
MDTATPLQLSSPAKVNLALSVGPPSSAPDAGGLHPIASWMVALTFGDRVSLATLPDGEPSRFDRTFAPGSDANSAPAAQSEVDWPLEKDLAFRAHALVEGFAERPLPVHAQITKRIPAGAGLGGGSSNAAAMIVGLNQLFGLHMQGGDLIELGRRIGSDVPFFIMAGNGVASALVSGFGEKVSPLPLRQTLHLVLVFPPCACPTGPVYAAFDRLCDKRGGCPPPDVARVRQLSEQSPLPPAGPFNDLADAAFEVQPALWSAFERVRESLNLPVHVTGSGSTLFVIAPSALTAEALARKTTALTGLPALATRTL